MMVLGERFRVTIFGSSHGPEVGVSIEGIPPGTPLDLGRIQGELDRRRPVGRRLATKRQEEDRLVVDAGYSDGAADGHPFRAHVANEDVRREPYDRMLNTPRPGHADYPARVRYGVDADLSGGGIFSGRMTVGLVIAGSIGRQMLGRKGIEIAGYTRHDVETRFGGMLSAFRFGAPPHGGSAPGIDRIVMLLADERNIREVITFPMTQQAEDLMMGAPAPIEPARLRELHLKLDLPPEKKARSKEA